MTAGALLLDKRLEWSLLGGLCLATFLLLATAGRYPSVDLPLHAVCLRRIIEGSNAWFEIRWSTPYLLFYFVAALFTPFTDPVRAVWITTSLVLAAYPLAAGTLASALGRSPLLGVFALLGAFTTITGWGFASLLMGAPMAAFAFAAALRHADHPTWRKGALLALALVACYLTHVVSIVVALPLAAATTLLRARPLRLRAFWPTAVGAAFTLALGWFWLDGGKSPAATGVEQTFVAGSLPAARLHTLVVEATMFGRQGALERPWTWLAALALLVAAVSWLLWGAVALWALPSVLRRGWRSTGAALRNAVTAAMPLAGPVVSFFCYLLAPLTMASIFLVYPRFLVFGALLWPAALAVSGPRVTRVLTLPALAVGLWLVIAARGEIVRYHDQTRCVGELAAAARFNEALKPVRLAGAPPGYPQPLFSHLAAEVTARRGGVQDVELADFGNTPVRFQPGVRRVRNTWGRDASEPREYTAWLVLHPKRDDIQRAYVFDRPVEVKRCGAFALATDRSVPAGSRPHLLRLPHPVGK